MNVKSDELVELCSLRTGSATCRLPEGHGGSHHWVEMPSLAAVAGPPQGRYDRVAAAYEGMSEADRATFRALIQDEEYTHAEIAVALRVIGYDVDRKQVHQFREKLALGRVTL